MKLKQSMGLLISSGLILSATSVMAGTFKDDLQYFKNALKSARFSEKDLDLFQNPLKGPMVYRLDSKRAPWAGNYFPMERGGIASRWQEPGATDDVPEGQKPVLKIMDVKLSLKKEDFAKMTAEQIGRLSPAEKYDLMMGDYEFSATKHELYNRGPHRNEAPEDWEGFCNGVRAAGILLPEPQREISVKNPDGIEVTFKIADLKALAGVSYFYVGKYSQIGSPSRDIKSHDQPNAAVFDLALRYFLAEKKKAFVVDSHLGDQIWNESVIGYDRKIEQAEMTAEDKLKYRKAVKKIKVNLTVETLGEVDIHRSDKETKSQVADGSIRQEINSGYYLYIDKAGNAIDGLWINGAGERGIDFAWFGGGQGTDSEHTDGEVGNPWLSFSKIKKLFSQSAAGITCKNIYRL
jgi:hypothetical protein